VIIGEEYQEHQGLVKWEGSHYIATARRRTHPLLADYFYFSDMGEGGGVHFRAPEPEQSDHKDVRPTKIVEISGFQY
jgi:hypothetical protein